MEHPEYASDDEIREYLEGWLDAMMEVYGGILEEWQEHNVVQPYSDATTEFQCNNCGKCCSFEEHWVWIYPVDLVRWMKRYYNDKRIPVLLGILFPVEDMEGLYGYGLPSQKVIVEKFKEFKEIQKNSKIIQRTFDMLLTQLRKMNKGFNDNSEYCIFYDPTQENHCLIYDIRPVQCQSYPYDYPQFCKIVIPEKLKDKYGASEEEDPRNPLCPPEAYSPPGTPTHVKLGEEEKEWVEMEKASYLTSMVTQDWMETDISELLLELFHKDILNLDRDVIIKGEGNALSADGTVKKFVQGKRVKKKTQKRPSQNRRKKKKKKSK